MAILAAEGHRVVLVVATLGGQGLSDANATLPGGLAGIRRAELEASARALGCARVVHLGYRDSGWGRDRAAIRSSTRATGDSDEVPLSAVPFSKADVEQAAHALAALLTEERAGLVTTYDPAGGYGHPDHRQVHRVGARAAALAGTPVVLQATYDRFWLTGLARVLRIAGPLRRFLPAFDSDALGRAYTARQLITHRVDVRRHLDAKRRSLAAHASQTTGGDSVRTLALLARLPAPLFRRLLGTEYYVRPGALPERPLRHPLATR